MVEAGVPVCSLVDSLSERTPKETLREHAQRSSDETGPSASLHLRPPLHSTAGSQDRPAPAGPAAAQPETDPAKEASTSTSETLIFDASDLEAQRKWNEERIERRLRGEWERVSRQLADLVSLLSFFFLRASS
jgi:outer membrane protein insertion porin family